MDDMRDLVDAEYVEAIFDAADISGAIWRSVRSAWRGSGELRLDDADLTGCDLRRVNSDGADLSGATMNQVKLAGADLRGANLDGIDLTALDFHYVRIDLAQAIAVAQAYGAVVDPS